MQTSKTKMLGKLYAKDLHEILPEILIVLIGVLLINAWFFLGSPEPAPVVMGPLFLLLGLAGFLPIVSSFKLLSREWANNTVYLIMSLPVSGAMVMGAKMLALITQYIVGTLLVGLSGYLFWVNGVSQFFGTSPITGMLHNLELVKYLLAFYFSGLAFIIFICCNSFFSQVVGKLSRKLSGLITTVVFIAVLVLPGKILSWILNTTGIADAYLNPLAIRFMTGPDKSATFLNALNISSLGQFLFALLIFILAVVLYDKKLEL